MKFNLMIMHGYLFTGISDEMCYCTFRIPNMEYATGAHTITFQSILNGEIRGSTTSRFIVTDSKLILSVTKHAYTITFVLISLIFLWLDF